MKIKSNIEFNFSSAWRAGVIVFLAVFAILIFLDILLFINASEKMSVFERPQSEFSAKTLDKKSLEEASLKIKQRKEIFEAGLLKGPDVKDPSLPL